MESSVITLLIAVPLAIGILNIILPLIIRKILVFLGLIFTLILGIVLIGSPATELTLFGELVFYVDGMSAFIAFFIQLLSFLILIFSLKGVNGQIEKHFFILYPLTVAFCTGVVLSDHIISFLIFWGLSGLALYLFSLLGDTRDAPKTAKKTFILIGGSDAFLILGLAIMAFGTSDVSWSLSSITIPLGNSVSIFAFLFLLVAAFTKAGGFPFHTWVPDFSKDTSVESAAFLPASLDKLLGIYLLARMMLNLFTVHLLMNMIVISLGALTVITAVMMAMIQHNGRKLLGYHAVSQVGYMIMGVGSGSILAFAGGLFHMVNHTIYKSDLFLTLGSVEKQAGTNNLDELGGLGKLMPVTFIMALIGALSISGIPPFNGFFSKWMVYQGLLEKASTLTTGYEIWMLVCLILAVFGSALTLASFMKFLHAIYLGKRPEKLNNIRETSFNQWIATGGLSLLCILFGLFAVSLPLRQLIYPVMTEYGWNTPEFIGLYSPQLLFLLFGIAFLVGLLIYYFTKNVRYAEEYIGGMSTAEKFRVTGAEFYNEIRNMTLLRGLYNAAEKKYFDVYDLGSKSTFAFSRFFQKAHPGQLQLYVLYIVIGFLIFLWLGV
jgi:multicomponent Na+:H+ antiporter subunit A